MLRTLETLVLTAGLALLTPDAVQSQVRINNEDTSKSIFQHSEDVPHVLNRQDLEKHLKDLELDLDSINDFSGYTTAHLLFERYAREIANDVLQWKVLEAQMEELRIIQGINIRNYNNINAQLNIAQTDETREELREQLDIINNQMIDIMTQSGILNLNIMQQKINDWYSWLDLYFEYLTSSFPFMTDEINSMEMANRREILLHGGIRTFGRYLSNIDFGTNFDINLFISDNFPEMQSNPGVQTILSEYNNTMDSFFEGKYGPKATDNRKAARISYHFIGRDIEQLGFPTDEELKDAGRYLEYTYNDRLQIFILNHQVLHDLQKYASDGQLDKYINAVRESLYPFFSDDTPSQTLFIRALELQDLDEGIYSAIEIMKEKYENQMEARRDTFETEYPSTADPSNISHWSYEYLMLGLAASTDIPNDVSIRLENIAASDHMPACVDLRNNWNYQQTEDYNLIKKFLSTLLTRDQMAIVDQLPDSK